MPRCSGTIWLDDTVKGPLALLTTGRQDLGLLRSSIDHLRVGSPISIEVWAGGMHLSRRFGEPLNLLAEEGIVADETLKYLSDPPETGRDAGRAVAATAEALRRRSPEALLLVGDRWETLAAGLAATVTRTPIAHLHGGEETEGAFDNALRHSLTKLAHLHLVSHDIHADRVIQMGEAPDAVHVVGAPGLDHLYRTDLPGRRELETRLGIELEPPVIVTTVHPTTLGGLPDPVTGAVAAAMEAIPATCVITAPNADPGGVEIAGFWQKWSVARDRVVLVDALGDRWYWGLLANADLVLGNSSSGIIEAPTAGVPSVNIGDRQQGRLRHPSTIDVPPEPGAVIGAAKRALGGPRPTGSVYPSGPAAPRIAAALEAWQPEQPPVKRFVDIPREAQR